MKKVLKTNCVRVLSLVLLMAICSVVLAEIIFKDNGSGEIDIEKTFDRGLYKYYIKNGFRTAADLVDDFNFRQTQWLPLVPPGMKFLTQPTGIRYFDPKRFPKEFCAGLLPVEIAGGVVVYPVIVREDPKTRERIFLNIKGKRIGISDPPKDYDWRWYLLEQYPDVYSGAYSKEDIALLENMNDPSRLALRYDLILKHDLTRYIMYLSLLPSPGEGGVGIMKAYGGGSVTNIQFVEMEVNDGLITMTVAYPDDFTNNLEFFACTNLLVWDWVLVATTNVNASTNWIEWTDQDSTNYTVRFYDVWNADADEDGDDLSDGREYRLYGTDGEDWDTDDDGVGDGDELLIYETDPINIHNSLLPYATGFESTNSYSAGTLDGQNGWESDAGATVQAGAAHTGSQAVELEALEAAMTKHFATTNNSVTTELFVYLGPQFSVPTNLPATASSMVSYDSGTGIRAFDGNGSGGGSWSNAPGTTNLLDQWLELKIVQNYSARTWSLYVDDSLKLSGLGFKNDNVTQLEAMHVRSGIGGAVLCDDINVQ